MAIDASILQIAGSINLNTRLNASVKLQEIASTLDMIVQSPKFSSSTVAVVLGGISMQDSWTSAKDQLTTANVTLQELASNAQILAAQKAETIVLTPQQLEAAGSLESTSITTAINDVKVVLEVVTDLKARVESSVVSGTVSPLFNQIADYKKQWDSAVENIQTAYALLSSIVSVLDMLLQEKQTPSEPAAKSVSIYKNFSGLREILSEANHRALMSIDEIDDLMDNNKALADADALNAIRECYNHISKAILATERVKKALRNMPAQESGVKALRSSLERMKKHG